ncbi:MAG: 30S ribosomal protein S1 [Candidatus Acidiferrales bacterium]
MPDEPENQNAQHAMNESSATATAPALTTEAATPAPERASDPEQLEAIEGHADASSTDNGTSSSSHGEEASSEAEEEMAVANEATTEEPSTPKSAELDATAGTAESKTTGDAEPTTTEAGSEGEATAAEMEQLMEQYATPGESTTADSESKMIEGRVIAVTELGVVVDIGGKSEGLVPAQEVMEMPSVAFTAGQAIDVERTGERKEGYILLSHLRARRRRIWQNIENSYREKKNVTGKVMERIKGGLVVDLGVRAFLPASQIEMRPVHDLEAWKDRELELRVIKLNRKRGNVVVSRRVILEEEQKTHRDALVEALEEGATVHGRVKNITDYGVFVDLGGLDGLLHVSDLTWGRITHPGELVKSGDEIDVKILKFDKEKLRISLGRKQLLPDPWATVPERYTVGARVKGKIVGVTDYGAFLQLEPGVEGLVHVSEMSWSRRVKHPSKVVKVGDEAEVVVLEVKPDQRRISLGLKQTQADPWEEVAKKYPVGTVVTGRVRNVMDFGAFVEIEEGIEGLVHVSDISWTERVKHPSEKFKKGDTLEAKVLKMDAAQRRLSLGIKQVNDIWEKWFGEHKTGELVRGRVARAVDFGVFVELGDGIEGLCHISEIEDRRAKGERQEARGSRSDRAAAVLHPGNEYEFKLIKADTAQHKISLSYRAAQKQAEKQEIETFRGTTRTPKSSPTATIGDAILAKRQASESSS